MQVLNDDGRTTSMREKILTITVKRGWKEGTRITFPKEGDQGPNKIPGQCRGHHWSVKMLLNRNLLLKRLLSASLCPQLILYSL